MSPTRKKTKAAKATARKAPTRKTTAKGAATKRKSVKTSKPKAAKTAKAKPKTTKAVVSDHKATAVKAPTAAPAPAQAEPRKRAPSRKTRQKPVHAPAAQVLPRRTPVAGEPRSRLGNKWECFSCGAKFYDLNKPEPLCPKCGANQLDRPKAAPRPKPSPQTVPPPASRAMAPLLDEDEDAMVVDSDELDLGLAGIDDATGDFMDEGEEEEPAAEEDEET